MRIMYNSGLEWYVLDSKTKTIIASQFDSRDEAEMWVKMLTVSKI